MDLAAKEKFGRNKIHPHKFALWAAMGGILMMFAALTSAYIVRHAVGNWLEFKLPNVFFVSAVVMLLSSITLQYSYRAFKAGNEQAYRILMVITTVLGLAFLGLQYSGWLEMESIGVFLDGNPSGSFIYVISGVHAAHVLGGIAVLVVALMHAFMLEFKVTEKRKVRFELTLTYWHFVDLLWIYLLFFLVTQ
ncbi:MAG: cytochrome c oxidase subunit 3 [Saprospiraceae bacterium]|nr:cytochrome c oxidase subunit 3 [Saprospiraceae bacterium]